MPKTNLVSNTYKDFRAFLPLAIGTGKKQTETSIYEKCTIYRFNLFVIAIYGTRIT